MSDKKLKVLPLKMQGEYVITKRRDGEVIEEATIHNLVTNGFVSRLIGDTNYFQHCQLGSGNVAPAKTDTNLKTFLWSMSYSSCKISETSLDGLTRTWTYTYVFPANSSYVGVIREVGLSASSNGALNTHALVVDSEGNPIQINKTYLDEITITAKISITRPKWDSGQTWAFDSGPLSRQYLYGLLSLTNNSYNHYICLAAQWCPEYRPIRKCQPTRVSQGLTYKDNTIYGAAEYSGDAMDYYYDSSSGQKYKDYVNSLMLGRSYNSYTSTVHAWSSPPYRFLLPNPEIFPVRTMNGMALGTGDGTKKDFKPEIPAWLPNTEKVYKNNQQMVRGVDYLVDHLANLDKYQSVMVGNFVAEIDAKKQFGVQGFIWGAYECTASSSNDNDWNSPIVTKDSPIIMKYAKNYAFSVKANLVKIGSWTASANIPAGAALVFYYSSDNGGTWHEFARVAHTANNNNFSDTTERKLDSVINDITHVKIALEGTDSDAYVRHSSYDSLFGYVGKYAIRFITAPANGEVLIIDMDIDRPWKSPDNVIQWNPVLTFGG